MLCHPPAGRDRTLSNHFPPRISRPRMAAKIAYGNGRCARTSLRRRAFLEDRPGRPLDSTLADSRKVWPDPEKLPTSAWRFSTAGVTFHAKLGTQGERVARIAKLAEELAWSWARHFARRAAVLAKADFRLKSLASSLASGRNGRNMRCHKTLRPLPHSKSTIARRARPMSCRPIRSRSPSRSPTSSTR